MLIHSWFNASPGRVECRHCGLEYNEAQDAYNRAQDNFLADSCPGSVEEAALRMSRSTSSGVAFLEELARDDGPSSSDTPQTHPDEIPERVWSPLAEFADCKPSEAKEAIAALCQKTRDAAKGLT